MTYRNTRSTRRGAVRMILGAVIAAATGAAAAAAGGQSPAEGEGTRPEAARRFDFGTASAAPGHVAVGPDTRYRPESGYGWVTEGDGADALDRLLIRDRGTPEEPLRDFVFARRPQVFRIDAPPGRYRLTITAGDADYSDHELEVAISGAEAPPLPVLRPEAGEFVTVEAVITVAAGGSPLDLTFRSPSDNWVVNVLTLTPAEDAPAAAPRVTQQRFKTPRAVPASTWGPVASWPDPTADYVKRFFAAQASMPPDFKPTGLSRGDYLKLIAGGVDFWKKRQDRNGAIIDPHRKAEFQYSTPAFAHAAALLVVYARRRDLREAAAKAMDWSARTLSERRAASGHEDFYPPMLAHALRLLKPHVAKERAERWEADLRRYDPFTTYRMKPGSNNWNVVALSGEYLFQKAGLRPADDTFVAASLATQGRHFRSPYGLYIEGPMAYDHFPRLWAADLVANGYDGPHAAELSEVLRRGALTSLFLQSPWGELPAGGRSAHHQWNEAEQCVTFEIYAARALRDGDAALAATFKRAAHLALASMKRWVRPSGELQIVKNWVDPAQSHGFETYSAHSQYGLLPLSMLAIAYEHAETTEKVAEKPAPADLGGFVLHLEALHKVVANAGGTYVEIDTRADHHYDATGLIRVHIKGVSPQLGPSDSLLASPKYRAPGPHALQTTGVGIAWQTADGSWRHLGELDPAAVTNVTVGDIAEAPNRVAFRVRYEGSNLGGPSFVEERYVVTPGRVELTTELGGYTGPRRYVWPVLADDGRRKSAITVAEGLVSVTQDGGKTAQTFRPVGAASVQVGTERYPNHNGWVQLAVAEYPAGDGVPAATLVIEPRVRR